MSKSINQPADALQRQQAIDPTQSFIIQAPAGSGKTELLTQRFLSLLSVVNKPEEIVAITFTRKAQGEMRHRILSNLKKAQTPLADDAPEHEKVTWQLAHKALMRNNELEWNLIAHPARLKIQTIDGFSASLVQQMPWSAKSGGALQTTDDAFELYDAAADSIIKELEGSNTLLVNALTSVLQVMSNNQANLKKLIATMLSKRDQWMRHIRLDDLESFRVDIEATLRYLVENQLQNTIKQLTHLNELHPLAVYAAGNISPEKESAISDLAQWDGNFTDKPQILINRLLGLRELLLTKDGSWRKTVNVGQGFPATGKAEKKAISDLIDTLSNNDELRESLSAINELPSPELLNEEWQFFKALITVLQYSVAQLQLTFMAEKTVDHNEVAQRAEHALGDEETPTELALKKDHQISHLLVDEFQDTSHGQFALFKALTREWLQTPEKTVFFVGDPMQSIYRFREGDVGLFIKTIQHGLGAGYIKPIFLRLTTNFRSQKNMVQWVNNSFSCIFPEQNDMARGGVCYSAATAFHPALPEPAVELTNFFDDNGEQEAAKVVATIKQLQKQNPQGTTAILTKARNHVAQIINALKQEGIRYKGVDLEPLTERQVIQDLLIITRALLHPCDGVAWIGMLRFPWCGLNLKELTQLLQGNQQPVIQLLQHPDLWSNLTESTQQRLQHLANTILQAYKYKHHLPLSQLVEGVWVTLGGPACAVEISAEEDAQQFFNLLRTLEKKPHNLLERLNNGLEKLYAAPDTQATDNLQIMTIHASKGLQFDQVIIPGLDKKSQNDDNTLLRWKEISTDNIDGILMAPVEKLENSSGLYGFIKNFEEQEAHYERQRLLYVAITRAKKQVFLLSNSKTQLNKKTEIPEIKAPDKSSFLNLLWPIYSEQLAADFDTYLKNHLEPAKQEDSEFIPKTAVLKNSWALPKVTGFAVQKNTTETEPKTLDNGSIVSQETGTLIHRYLELIHNQGLNNWNTERVQNNQTAISYALKRAGVQQKQHIERGTNTVIKALQNILTNNKGQWLLDNTHKDSKAELELMNTNGELSIVDRTFIHNNTRYIVDYKSSKPQKGETQKAFFEREKTRYAEQLNHYGSLFSQKENLPIKLILWFVLVNEGVEWEYEYEHQ